MGPGNLHTLGVFLGTLQTFPQQISLGCCFLGLVYYSTCAALLLGAVDYEKRCEPSHTYPEFGEQCLELQLQCLLYACSSHHEQRLEPLLDRTRTGYLLLHSIKDLQQISHKFSGFCVHKVHRRRVRAGLEPAINLSSVTLLDHELRSEHL